MWTQTMDLKFMDGVLHQRWYRIRTHNGDTKRGQIQHQWRPIQGQGRSLPMRDLSIGEKLVIEKGERE